MRTTALISLLAIAGGLIVSLLIFVGIAAGSYNGLMASKTLVEKERAQIETQLQRRFDLVPGLVNSVRGAMKQEQAVFDAIATARTGYAGTQANSPERLQASQQYESAISRLLVVMENYPELKSIDTVKDLMTQLEGSENRISVARQRYNEVVLTHNTKIRSFPTNFLAGFFGVEEEPMFDAVEAASQAVPINFEDIDQ